MYILGKGKADITAFEKGVGMLGFGMHFHTMEGVETPLFARAFVIQQPSTNAKIVYVNCELAFITNSLKQGVLKALDDALPNHGIKDETLLLSAQHSHSTPAGYAYYGIYNISVPGFNINVYNKLVAGIVEAIVEAHTKSEACDLAYNEGVFDLSKNVAFNRSPLQYNQNPEVTEKITAATTNKGVDRTMYQLMFFSKEKKCLGLINWFGVHTTSVSNDLNKLCSDNKGYASTFTEEKLGEECLSVFAQGTCGDITPRFKYNPKRKYQRGKWDGEFEDDYKSAAYNGRLQSEKSLEILANTDESNMVANTQLLDSAILHVDFTKVHCNPKFANGNLDAHTGPANMGLDFLGGAYVDGPGMHPALVKILRKFNQFRKWRELKKAKKVGGDYEREVLHKYKTQGAKSLAFETTERKSFGFSDIEKSPLPGWLDPAIDLLKNFYKKEGYKDKPWSASILPLQITLLGQIAIASFPFEITTIAAKRLRDSLYETLKKGGIKEVILAPYTNDFSGYVTTYEEYQVQMYEGGHTVFGEWTLAALQTKFDQLAKAMLEPKSSRVIKHDASPVICDIEEMKSFAYYIPKWYKKKHKIA